MNKYEAGSYIIELFDKYGTKQKTLKAENQTEAVAKGKEFITEPPYANFVTMRVTYNSMDKWFPWSARNIHDIEKKVAEHVSEKSETNTNDAQ